MFFGTTPNIVAQFAKERIVELKPKNSYILFAGNFVLEQLIGKYAPTSQLHSTDVSLYSMGIGFGVTGKEFKAVLNKDVADRFKIMGKTSTPLEKAAEIIFMTEVSQNMAKEDISYYRQLVAEAILNEEVYFNKLMLKMQKFQENVKNMIFYGVDACKLEQGIGENDFVFYDPPVLLGDYEKMFKGLEACYDYDHPDYTQMNDDIKQKSLDRFDKLGANVLYRTNNPVREDWLPSNYKEVFRAGYKRASSYCIYTNIKESKTFIFRHVALIEKVKHYKFISVEDTITNKSKVEVIEVPSVVGNHYRLMWVGKAEMTDTGVAYLIFVDGKLIGMFQLATALIYGSSLVCIFSDPSCPHSKYERLSKLVLALICTRPVIAMYNKKVIWEHTGFTTRANTNADTSMKYRQLFKLISKTPDTEQNYKNLLIYHNTDKIFRTYKEALTWWLDKDGKALNKNNFSLESNE